MAWTIKFAEIAAKQLKKVNKKTAKQILKYLGERIASNDPRQFGKQLLHDKSSMWRYRIGKYRIICKIEDDELVVMVLRIGHRQDVYK